MGSDQTPRSDDEVGYLALVARTGDQFKSRDRREEASATEAVQVVSDPAPGLRPGLGTSAAEKFSFDGLAYVSDDKYFVQRRQRIGNVVQLCGA